MTDPTPGTPEFHRRVLEWVRDKNHHPIPIWIEGDSPADGRVGRSISAAAAWALDQIGPANVTPIGVRKLTMEETPAPQILMAAAEDETITHCVIIAAHREKKPTVRSTTSDMPFSMMLAQEGLRQMLDMVDWEEIKPEPYPGGGKVLPLAPKS